MIKVKDNVRVILIGGSSHSGKSTVARTMANKIGWSFLSTDRLARHPGRPWRKNPKDIPKHVVEHYSTLSVYELFEDVLSHYRRVWSNVKAIISLYANDPSYGQLIIEGSAIWPEFVADHNAPNTRSIWLTAENDQFQERIYRESNFEQVSDVEKCLIEKFLKRTQLFNEKMMAVINQRNLMSIEVNDGFFPDDVSDICLQRIC
ncbi:MAG: 2-phosphoglycerate kinase [Chloroflexota bacterium]|nr:2-phosphoglycerate kinase [Chloroflexota bacterium]